MGELVEQLTDLVNDVYTNAESGLWRDGFIRTRTSDFAELVAAGQVAVATIADGVVVGSMQFRQISADTSEFGMLVADADNMVRGIFSISQIARQLGVALPTGGSVARTFSEIEAALVK